MATVIRMPEVLAGSAEAAIQTWLVTPGQALSVGVPLAEVETEKAVVEYASEHEGTVLQLLVAEGVSVKVGDPIAVVGAEGEAVDVTSASPEVEAPAQAPAAAAAPAAVPQPAPAPAPAAVAPAVSAEPGDASGRQFISPLVRRLARERGLDLSTVQGFRPRRPDRAT